MFELRETRADQAALLAYSSLWTLVKACGTGQSWTRVKARDLAWLRRRLNFDVVALDMALPAELRHPELDATDFPDLEPVEADDNPMDTVYVPSRPYRSGDQQIRLELQPGPNGEPAMLAYFSPGQLHAACGPHQPWVAIRADSIEIVARKAGARRVWFNATLPERAWHRAP